MTQKLTNQRFTNFAFPILVYNVCRNVTISCSPECSIVKAQVFWLHNVLLRQLHVLRAVQWCPYNLSIQQKVCLALCYCICHFESGFDHLWKQGKLLSLDFQCLSGKGVVLVYWGWAGVIRHYASLPVHCHNLLSISSVLLPSNCTSIVFIYCLLTDTASISYWMKQHFIIKIHNWNNCKYATQGAIQKARCQARRNNSYLEETICTTCL